MNKILNALFPRAAKIQTAMGVGPMRHIHHEDSKNDFNIRIMKAANGHIVQGQKHDGCGNMLKDELHIVHPDENLIDAVAKVIVAMQMG